eukprot:4633374-Pyramimonas_sp.AAC.1
MSPVVSVRSAGVLCICDGWVWAKSCVPSSGRVTLVLGFPRFDHYLANDAVAKEYYRFEPYLCQAAEVRTSCNTRCKKQGARVKWASQVPSYAPVLLQNDAPCNLAGIEIVGCPAIWAHDIPYPSQNRYSNLGSASPEWYFIHAQRPCASPTQIR